MRKKLMCIILASIFCLCGLGMLGGCNWEIGYMKEYIYEDFIYEMSVNKDSVNISYLSEQGKTKKNIVVPSEINGLPVESLSDELLYGERGEFISDALERIYLPNPVKLGGYFWIGGRNFKKILILDKPKTHYSDARIKLMKDENHISSITIPNELMKVTKEESFYLEEHYRYICYSYRAYESTIKRHPEDYCVLRSVPANVTYDYNYAESKNDGVYWIDDYGYGEQITFVPPIPERDGYTFGGWYKDAECTQAWDFAVDTLPEERRTEDGYLIYQETVLYAQWI